MSARLEGKVCVITGRGGRMGRASPHAFAREGALVVGYDQSEDAAEAAVELVRGSGADVVSEQPCHLTDPAGCQALVDLFFYLTRAAWPQLKASRGVVVNRALVNASLTGKVRPSLSHTTNKAGIVGMTRQLAMEGSEHGIRVNSISPGRIEIGAARDQLEDPRCATHMVARTLLGRRGRPKAVANMALFLASDESSCMTGAGVLVDGGMKVG
jgi:NAD(P)-dependent dehydrogenase (short-subunit alcohol dehydrogenase family)